MEKILIPERKLNRLKEYDYSCGGYYYVTIYPCINKATYSKCHHVGVRFIAPVENGLDKSSPYKPQHDVAIIMQGYIFVLVMGKIGSGK